MEHELDNLLKINDMYQDTIKSLEDVIDNKDNIIQDHLHTVAKLTEGNAQELKDIKLMFFSKQKDLVDALGQNREKHQNEQKKFNREIEIRESIKAKLQQEISDLKEELLLAKRILRDPNLSQLATRKFKSTINQDEDHKFTCKGAVITDIIQQNEDENAQFECEMKSL